MKNALLLRCGHIHSVLLRKSEMTCRSRVLHHHRHLSSLPSLRLSSQMCAMMQKRLGEATSTSLCLTQMDPVPSTLFMCFPHFFRYYSLTLQPA